MAGIRNVAERSTLDSNGKVLDTNKYYWALAEMIAAAGLLGQRTGKAVYWEWYDMTK